MQRGNYDEIAHLEDRNWWYVARREIADSILKKAYPKPAGVILDVGCGVGSNLPSLRPYAKEVIGLDISPLAVAYSQDKGYGTLLEANAENIPLPDESVDAVVCMDVLEHVDDKKTMLEIKRVLKPGGVLLATVPAFMSLWNENDDYSHHLRRYRKNQLAIICREAGFEIERVFFWNSTMFIPVWLAARFYRKGKNPEQMRNNLERIPGFLNPLLIALTRCEHFISGFIRIPFGVSLVLVAHKK